MLIYAIVGALVVGLSLGIFGSGGSILTVPVLIYLLHHEDKAAIAESLAIVGAIALFSALPYARSRLVDWRTAFLFGLPAMAGTYLGAWVAGFVPGVVQLLVFAGVMLLAAVQMWRRSKPAPMQAGSDASQSTPGSEPHGPKRSVLRIGVDGIVVGALTGFVGVGGGFLIVPALVLLGGLSMRRAVGTSLVVIALKSGVGFWKYLEVLGQAGTSVEWATIGVFVAFGVVGSFAGKLLNERINQRALQRAFAVFLVAMACFIAARESFALLTGDTAAAESEMLPEIDITHGRNLDHDP